MNNSISIISSLIIFLFPYIGRKWFNRQILSSTVVSLGLLGTFGGIMFGLWVFGIERISESIPQLLEGLKTAFLTSIAGMVSSLLLKLCPAFYGIKKEGEEDDSDAVLLQLLADIRDNTRQSSQVELISEIRQLKDGFTQSFTALNHSLTQLSEHEIEINTETISQALEEIINHLDNKISEQINQALEEIKGIQEKQLECLEKNQELNQALHEQLRETLEKLQAVHQDTEQFLNKSTNLNFRQNENLTTQLNQIGNLVQTSGEQFQTQLTRMEEKYEKELSEMEKFTKTLMLIIKKLTQDHESLTKTSESTN